MRRHMGESSAAPLEVWILLLQFLIHDKSVLYVKDVLYTPLIVFLTIIRERLTSKTVHFYWRDQECISRKRFLWAWMAGALKTWVGNPRGGCKALKNWVQSQAPSSRAKEDPWLGPWKAAVNKHRQYWATWFYFRAAGFKLPAPHCDPFVLWWRAPGLFLSQSPHRPLEATRNHFHEPNSKLKVSF